MPGGRCSYKNCFNSRYKVKGLKMFVFPWKKPICDLWIQRSGNPELIGLSPASLKLKLLCERHFQQEDILPSGRLIHGALPIKCSATVEEVPVEEGSHQPQPPLRVHRTEGSPRRYPGQSAKESPTGLDSELNEITVEVDPTFADYSTIVPDCDDRQRRWNGTFAPIKEVLTSSSLTGNSGSILLEIDSPEAKQRIIESCLKKPNLTADDVVAYVREYLNQSKPRDESMSTHLEDGSPAPKRTKKLSFNAPLKIEEELTLEDYGDTNDNMEFETEKEHENIAAIKGENNREVQAFPHKAEGPFETIICGTSDVQIKQEIFEDERENPTEELTSWVAEGTENRLASTTNITPNIAASQDQMAPKRTKETPKTTKCLQHSNSLLTSSGMQKCRVCKEPFSSLSELVEHCILHHSDSSSKFLPASEPKFTPTAVPEIPQFIPATTPGNNVCSNPVTKATSTSGCARAKCIPEYNSTTTTEPVVGNISSGTTLPNPTGPNWIPPYISACDVLDGIFVSLRTIPFENRKATIDKIVEFVSYMSKGDIDPSAISFVITKK